MTESEGSRHRAWLWFVAGILSMATGGIAWFMMIMGGGGFLSGAVGGLAAYCGVRWVNHGRRLSRAGLAPGYEVGTGAQVLYLRSFRDDEVMAKGISSGVGFGAFAVVTEEEQLVEALRPIGHVTAIGKPGEALPELGAYRQDLRDEEWQTEVAKAMARAELVVLRPGSSQGVWWELQHAIAILQPKKLLLVLPFDVDGYERFRRRFEQLLGHKLPDYTLPRKRDFPAGSLRALLYFDPDWTPHLVTLNLKSVSFFRRSISKRAVPIFQVGLRPVFENLGIEWREPPISAGQVVLTAGLVLFFMGLLVGALAELLGLLE